MKLVGRRIGGVKIALLGLLGAVAASYGVYRIFAARTGEAAVSLIPADAQCVVTLDTHPSEAQVAAFMKLTNALKREKLDSDLESGVNDLIGKAGIARDVRQYLTNNMATAWWKGANGKKTHGIALFSINNPNAVSRVLSSGTLVKGALSPAYSFATPEMVTSVIGDYLAIATDIDTILRVEQTQASGNSIGSLAEYRTARAALPSDANVMVFISPSTFKQFLPNQQSPTSMWLSYGISLRDGGIQFDYRGPIDSKTFPGMSELSNMAPLSKDLLKRLPPDAYGLFAVSSMDKYYPVVKVAAAKATSEENFRKGEADFEKETGMSIVNDIVPAFKGDAVVAIYPDAAGSAKSADGIVLIDNANGGTPAGLAEKVRAYIERKSWDEAAKSGKPAVHFVEREIGKTTVWQLDDASALEMQKSMGGNRSPKPDPVFGDKNIEYAVNNGSLLIATSDAMMAKAILVFDGDRTLADDPAFADMAIRVGEKDQMMFMCSLSRVVDRFKEQMRESMKGTDFTADDWVNLFGGQNAGLVGSAHYENETATGTLFLPLDFDRMAMLIRTGKESFAHPKHVQPIPDSTGIMTK